MPRSLSAEAYRSLRTSIKFSSSDKLIKTIVVTSSLIGEGKSTVVGNLAYSLNQDGSRVLVIDCDLRKPSIHENFLLSNEKGLTDILVGKSDLKSVTKKIEESLFLITAGTIPPNPAEMLDSKVMSSFLEECRNNYDHIILDTPPLQAVTDAQVLSTKADGTLMVIKANFTKKNDVESAVDMIKKVNGKIIGTVLNATKDNKC